MRLSRKNGEGKLLIFPEWGRIVETLPLTEDGMRLENQLNGKHQGVSLGDVMALINNGNAELNCILTALCSDETICLTKKKLVLLEVLGKWLYS